jgi:hypothetical protein
MLPTVNISSLKLRSGWPIAKDKIILKVSKELQEQFIVHGSSGTPYIYTSIVIFTNRFSIITIITVPSQAGDGSLHGKVRERRPQPRLYDDGTDPQ